MPQTKIRSTDQLAIDGDLDLNGKRAKNVKDAEQPKDAITKEQLDAEVEEATKWGTKDW